MYSIEDLYRQYFKDIYLYIKAISKNDDIAEEITQETFFKALKSIHSFRGDCDIRIWLIRIAKNTYLSYCEKNKRIAGIEPDTSIPDRHISIEEDIVRRENVKSANEILSHMEEPYQKVFRLRVFSELSFREIGNMYGKTEGWARVTYHRARLKIIKETEEL